MSSNFCCPCAEKGFLEACGENLQKQGSSCLGLSLAFFNELAYLGGEQNLE